MKTCAVIPAAGKGKRLGYKGDKAFICLKKKPLLVHTAQSFQDTGAVDDIIIVVSKDNISKAKRLVEQYGLTKVRKIVKGGKERGQSVLNGVKEVSDTTDIILVHDAARPFIKKTVINKAINAAKKNGASCVCVKVKPTIKAVDEGYIERTIDRCNLWEAQTPQVFKKHIALRMYQHIKRVKNSTDDSFLAEEQGFKVAVVQGDYSNIKITTKEDLSLALYMMNKKR